MTAPTPAELRELEHRMVMARPWDVAEHDSLWEITGAYPGGKHSFTSCLAITLPSFVTGSDYPTFVFVGILADLNRPVDPKWITHAVPLLLVNRDNPTEPYWENDRVWITAGRPATVEETPHA
jgi:hypothetical protein